MAKDDDKKSQVAVASETQPSRKPTTEYLPGSEVTYFSDLVKVRTGENGTILSFCTHHPDDPNVLQCQLQIFVPPKVAGALTAVLVGHMAKYQDKYKRRIVPESLRFELLQQEKVEG